MNGRFSKQLLARLNQSLDIVQLISKYVQLKRNGNRYLGLCPFHNEKTPSFVVTPEKNMFYCFGCHEHGSPIDFYMKINQTSFPETVKHLAKEVGITIENSENNDYECLDKLTTWCQQNLAKQPSILKQLNNRQLDNDCLKFFKVGFMPSIQPQALCKLLNCKPQTLISIGITNESNNNNRFRQRIIFPIYDSYGQVIAFGGRSIQANQQPKYINSPETKHFKKNSVIYNIHNAKRQGIFILVEGYMDVIKLHRHSYKGAVALMGTSFNEERIQNLVNNTEKLYICYDGDNAGQTAANKVGLMCLKYLGPNCEMYVIRLPENHDPDSYLDKFGKDAFDNKIKQAKTLSLDVITQIEKQFPLNKTINKSRFKQQFLKLSELIQDSIFKKEFKDIGFKILYGNNNIINQPKIEIDKDFTTWIDRLIYLIAANPTVCHELNDSDMQALLNLRNTNHSQLKFIGNMVNMIINNHIETIDQLIQIAQKKDTINKLTILKQKKSYLSPEECILEIQGNIHRLLVEQNKYNAQQLINKSKHNTLSTEERNKLIELIKKEKT